MILIMEHLVFLVLLQYYGFCVGNLVTPSRFITTEETGVRNTWGPSKSSVCTAEHVLSSQNPSTDSQEQLYIVNCSSRHIFTIPVALPVQANLVVNLYLSKNKISDLPGYVFKNFTKLRELHINKNPVDSMSSFVFKGLVNLRSLWMSQFHNKQFLYQYENLEIKHPQELFNSLEKLHFLDLGETCYNVSALTTALSHVSSTLTHLVMNRVFCVSGTSSIWIVDDNFFGSLAHTKLIFLSMEHNKIALIKHGSVILLRHLQSISLRNNFILGDRGSLIDMTTMKNLVIVDFGKSRWPWEQCSGRSKLYHNVYSIKPFLDLFFGVGKTLKTSSEYKLKISFLPKLRYLIVDNTFKTITEIDLIQWKICWQNNLFQLDISYTYVKIIIGTFWCMSTLKILYMTGFGANHFDPKFFYEMPSLELLDLSESSGNTIFSNQSGKIFSKNSKLKYLKLSNMGVTWLPYNLFDRLTNLEVLDISKNHLSTVQFQLKHLKSLTDLDISYNQIRHLDDGFVSQLLYIVTHRNKGKILTVNLNGNPLLCNCFILDPLSILLTSKFHIFGYWPLRERARPSCTLNNGTEALLTKAVTFLEEQCETDDIKLFFEFYIFFLVIILICPLAYRFRWRLLLLWYYLRQRTRKEWKRKYDFEFDAFVCYSSKDLDWVLHKLLPALGSKATHGHLGCKTGKFNFCLSDCHFMPGIPIVDNINHAISNSRYTVLFVTKAFIHSGWCRLEADLAQVSSVLGPQKVVVVVHPKVFKLPHLPKSVETLLKTVTCVEWPLLEQREKIFWLRLSEALQT